MGEYGEAIRSLILFALLSAATLRISFVAGFFRSPIDSQSIAVPFSFVVLLFAIYLGITTFVAPFCAFFAESFFLKWVGKSPSDEVFAYLQLALLGMIFFLFHLSTKSFGKHLFHRIWKQHRVNPSSIAKDLSFGVLGWIISFPIVSFISQGLDLFLYSFTPFHGYEQVAITYLKNTIHSSPLLITALLTILVAAPCIEEFLFRGCLQTYLKGVVSTKSAIVLSSLCFSLFHFSTSQGLGNISLCASLFVLALFLGFLYERQGSLFASVSMHFTFNAISSLRVLFE